VNGDKDRRFEDVVGNGMELEVTFCADYGGGSGDGCLEGFGGGGNWQSAYLKCIMNGVWDKSNFCCDDFCMVKMP
jgi:hypothetical protein